MKKFTIAALVLLVAGTISAQTVTVTNRGREIVVGVMAPATRTNVDDFAQAPVLPALDVLRALRVGTDLTVAAKPYIATALDQAAGNRTTGYTTITDGTNLAFIVTATNGATALVTLASPITNVVTYGIIP